MESKRFCIDIDGVVCTIKTKEETYADVMPIEGAIENINKLYEEGHYIILYTARHMKTCEGNVGKIINRVGGITIEWLKRYGVKYHELYFGKPWAHIYIDDNAFRLNNWNADIETINKIVEDK
jgi:capsule biosynthesis phosphatase